MEIKEKIGGLVLTHSGSMITNGDPLTIIMDNEYTIIFSFAEDSASKEQRIDLKTNNNSITFMLYNFDNPLGSAITKPIEFARKNGKSIYISFCVYSIGSAKLFHYNLFC